MALDETKLLADANRLAREFNRLAGYHRPEGYRFDGSSIPVEKLCWALAGAAFRQLLGLELPGASIEAIRGSEPGRPAPVREVTAGDEEVVGCA